MSQTAATGRPTVRERALDILPTKDVGRHAIGMRQRQFGCDDIELTR